MITISYYQLNYLSLHFLWLGDIGASRCNYLCRMKQSMVKPDNEDTIEINVNININGTNGKYPASGNCFTPGFK